MASLRLVNGLAAPLAGQRPRLQLKAVSKPEHHSFGGMVSPKSPAHARVSDWTATPERLPNAPEAFAAALPVVEQRQSIWQTLMSLLAPQESDMSNEDDMPFDYAEEEHSRHGWGHWPIAESMAVAKAGNLRSFVGTSVELDG